MIFMKVITSGGLKVSKAWEVKLAKNASLMVGHLLFQAVEDSQLTSDGLIDEAVGSDETLQLKKPCSYVENVSIGMILVPIVCFYY